MTRMMDGVQRTQLRPGTAAMAVPMPMVMPQVTPRPKARAISRATSKATQGVRYVTGMDGIRRAVPLTPREMLANMQAPAAEKFIEEMETPVLPAAVAALPQRPVWKMPSVSLPLVQWRRPVVAFGLVATALIASGATVSALSTPHATTARAAEATPSTAPATPPPTPAAAVVPVNTGLQKILDDFSASNPGKFGIVVKDLKTGETATVNPDRQLMSASLYKLFVAQRIYQRIDIGQLDYSSPAGGGTGRNVGQCLTIMINISDNACGRALGTILGWGAQDQALKLEGYSQTSLVTPQQTSAADVATLFTRLYKGTLVSSNSSDGFMRLLKDQRVNNRLPVGLPAGTVIAHKTGDLDGVVHDAGIVYGPKTDYLVVVTSGPWQFPGNAPGMFANLSHQLWDYFQK